MICRYIQGTIWLQPLPRLVQSALPCSYISCLGFILAVVTALFHNLMSGYVLSEDCMKASSLLSWNEHAVFAVFNMGPWESPVQTMRLSAHAAQYIVREMFIRNEAFQPKALQTRRFYDNWRFEWIITWIFWLSVDLPSCDLQDPGVIIVETAKLHFKPTCDHNQLLCRFMSVYFMCIWVLLFVAQKWSRTSSLRSC